MVQRKSVGFALVEVLVVVAIIAILAAIAYPSYTNYSFRTRRADGKEFMMRIANAQERYYTNLNRYGTLADLGLGSASESGYYTVAVALANANQSYTLTASPSGNQSSDKCGNLTLTSSGSKGYSGNQNNGSCW
ncbi:MAG: prepilin-type N-terminal cleavage/methylation domain-containing protein [Gammaproteobacteria bacterium]|nr:MAG: prepilin-type N-terminal cleavage/methylation domain-containing protein [Gammaproteobacteria bacterium]